MALSVNVDLESFDRLKRHGSFGQISLLCQLNSPVRFRYTRTSHRKIHGPYCFFQAINEAFTKK
jgi:hypothetical protein